MKYLVVHLKGMMPGAILFPPHIAHSVIAKRLRLKPGEILSAGYCRIDGDQVETTGFSSSLGLGPLATDARLISTAIQDTNREFPSPPGVCTRTDRRSKTGQAVRDWVGWQTRGGPGQIV